MEKRMEGYFKGFKGVELFYQQWISKNPKGSLVVTHGLGEHSDCYDRLAQAVLEDWNVYVWGLRGHGRSEGQRGIIDKFEDYCEDLMLFTEFVLENREEKGPLILLGHSMGGLIMARSLVLKGDMEASGLVMSSPLFGIAVNVSRVKEFVGKFISQFLPNWTQSNQIEDTVLTHDAEVLREIQRDPLRHNKISMNLFMAFLEHCEIAKRSAANITLPILIQQAGEDYVVSVDSTRQFYNNLGSENKKLIVYDGEYHEIYNELKRDHAFSDLRSWLKSFI